MKHLLTIAFCAGILTAYAQEKPFILKGKIKGQESGYLKLAYPAADGKWVQDSAFITNGNFEFKGKVDGSVRANFTGAVKGRTRDDPNQTSLFIEPGNLSLEVSAGDFKNLRLTGSKTQDEYIALEVVKKQYSDQMRTLSAAYDEVNMAYIDARKAGKSEAEQEALKERATAVRDKMGPFRSEINKIEMDYIRKNPDSYYVAYLLTRRISSMPLAESKASYRKLSDRIKQSSYGKGIAQEIKSMEGGSPGSIASVFASNDINGKPLSLADFKGKKYVLVDFWASWCVPCRKGNPHLLSLYSKYKDKGLEIVGVSDDDNNHAAWRKAVEQDQIGVWKHVLRGLKRTPEGGFDKSEDIAEPYAIHSLPTKILINKNGIIIGRYGGGGENDEAMDKKLAEIFK